MAHRFAPRTTRDRVLSALALGALLEILWTVYLGWRLPRRYDANHWALAWVGLDVLEIILLLASAWAAWKRRAILILFAVASATLLILDAWFDITTAGRGDLLQSVLLAAFVEVPSALALLWVARRAARRFLLIQTSSSDPLLKVPLAPPEADT